MDLNPLVRQIVTTYRRTLGPAAEASAAAPASDGSATEYSSSTAAAADSVVLSNLARDLPRARAAARAAPDGKSERVNKLKGQIQDGSYQVNVEGLAKRLMSVLYSIFPIF